MGASTSPAKTRAKKGAATTTAPEPTTEASPAAPPASTTIPKSSGRSDFNLILLSLIVLVVASFVGSNPGLTLNFLKSHGIDVERHLDSFLQREASSSSTTTPSPEEQVASTGHIPPTYTAPASSRKEYSKDKSIAVPAAGPRQPGFEDPNAAFFRPRVLHAPTKTNQTVSLGNPHTNDSLQLFLHRNGFSDDPHPFLLTRASFCSSDIPRELSQFMPSDCETRDGKKCRVFLHNGWEVSSCDEIQDNDHVWLVTPGREFIWPTFDVGTRVEVRHVSTLNHKPLIVETLSTRPKVFSLENFFNDEEAEGLISNALGLTDPSNCLKRSTTGQGANAHEDSHRTSENAWDMVSKESNRLKRRIFELLGMRPYQDAWADGLQVLRYNLSQAYNSHLDYLDFTPGSRLDSAKPGGANRFATVVLYLSDVEDGGETVFPNFAPPGQPMISDYEAREIVKSKYDMEGLGFTPGSWQELLVAHCKTRLAVRPQRLKAVLFYDQHPDGRQDDDALHGGCPVLSGTKWAANLWVWNGNVHDSNDFQGQNAADDSSIKAVFISTVPGYALYWQDTFFGEMQENVPINMNTFVGHSFNIRLAGDEGEGGPKVQTFTVGPNTGNPQVFTFTGVQG